MIVVGERGISRTVADADGYALTVGGWEESEMREPWKATLEDLMLTSIKINGQPCTLTCHLIPPCVILIDQ